MHFEQLIPFTMFATITSVTPGPNNTMLLVAGVNYGFKRSLPHLLGISVGFALMVFAVGCGLHATFEAYPVLQTIMKYLGASYLLWLAWKMAHAGMLQGSLPGTAKPMTFIQAALFQWVNPKAWVIAMGAITTFLPHEYTLDLLALMSILFGLLALPCNALWNVFGLGVRRLLSNGKQVKIFNYTMAMILVASIIPVFIH